MNTEEGIQTNTRTLSILKRLGLGEENHFLVLTLLIGILAGLCAVLFILAIEKVDLSLFGPSPSGARMVLIPIGISLVAGFLLARFYPEARGRGVPQTEAAFRLTGGVMHARTVVGKFVTGALCIGAGHSLGREGPCVQIGGALASSVGQWLRLSPEEVKNLIPVGASAGLSAAFNTPIAAVLFALEEIVGDMNYSILGSTVLASASAVVVERSILGNKPLFEVPTYSLQTPEELLAYAGLGIVCAAASVAFCKGMRFARAIFLRLPPKTVYLQPAAGGLMIGLMLLVFPQVKGVGYDVVTQALQGRILTRMLAVLAVAKLISTIISYASGNSGGIFAPTIFIGAMVGGFTGAVVHAVVPFPTAAIGAYALVGMGAVFAGIIRAPMTSIFMIFEMTQDYAIIVPLMIAVTISYFISRGFEPYSIYHSLLRQDHVHMPRKRAYTGRLLVRDIMKWDAKPLLAEESVRSAYQRAQDWGVQSHPVVREQQLIGTVTMKSLKECYLSGDPERSVSTLPLDVRTTHVHPDEPVPLALERLCDSQGVLPVVLRIDARQLQGTINLESALQAAYYVYTARPLFG